MSEMVERVARFLAAQHGDQRGIGWRDFEQDARTAIEAMRNPTPKMLEAAQNLKGQQSYTDIYKAMINAALLPS